MSAGTIGPYRILERLGEGGMGEVWLAEQTRPVRRQVALKVIKAGMDTAQVVARFEAERQALALMDHPAIAKVFDAGATDLGRPYFVMERVRGESLTAYCDRERLTIPQRLELFLHVCEGVQHAHQKGIIHRDLKPSNILVTALDDRVVPKIIDFGVAKAISQPLTEHTLFTSIAGFVGTPEYMSPEQAEAGGIDIDTRTDVYALGVILYELLTGVLPFDWQTLKANSIDEIRRTIRESDPVRPSTRIAQLATASTDVARARGAEPSRLRSLLRGDLDWITMKALEKDRTRRYGSASDLAADISRHLTHEPVLAGPPSAAYRSRKFVQRHRFGVGTGATLAVLLLSSAIVMAVQAGRIERERDRANDAAVTATQISNFLVGLFKVSDPSEARGRTITAREILDKGAGEVERLRDQPVVQARLQATIGSVYTNLGLLKDAEPLLLQSVRTYRTTLGDDHGDTLSAINALADWYWYQSRFSSAEPLYLELVQRTQRIFGKEHPRTLKAEFDLASLYIFDNRLAEGERLTLEVLRTQRRILGEEHADTLSSMTSLQAVYFRQKRYADALPIASQVLESRRRVSGEDHRETLIAAHNVATINQRLGRFEEAEPLFISTLAAETRVLGEGHRDSCRTRVELARMYSEQKRYREAEPLLLKAHEGFASELGPVHPSTLAVIRQLVTLYEAWGRGESATEWRNRLPPSN
jgi:non-specific serine/threonine protein kinase/serine/threonine-protein kinase